MIDCWLAARIWYERFCNKTMGRIILEPYSNVPVASAIYVSELPLEVWVAPSLAFL